MQKSIKIRLSRYAILEYIYATKEHTIAEYTFQKVKNISRNVSIFINEPKANTTLKNVLDTTFIELETDRVGHCDIDQPFSLVELDSNIDLNDTLNIPTDLSVVYDTVRLHLLAGYNLYGLDGIGVRLYGEENTGDVSYLASQIYTPTEQTINLNPQPFNVGEQVYDRYIEFDVPSLAYLNEQYYNLSTYTDRQLASYLTVGGKGFKKESPIHVEFFQMVNFIDDNGKLTFNHQKITSTTISQIDENSLISGIIRESDEGDYFEFFATYDNRFIEDYISELNSQGQSYSIVNNINVWENYPDLTRKKVQELSYIQTSDFDTANKFRPVISDNAYSFTIQYEMLLINQIENTQIVRTLSYTGDFETTKKYGENLNSIQINDNSSQIKIYNRITENPYTLNLSKPIVPTIQTIVSEIVKYTDSYKISIQSENVIDDLDTTIINNKFNSDNFIFGNGFGVIYLSAYDNFLKFKFYNKELDKLNVLPLLNIIKKDENQNEKLSLVVFENNSTKKYIECDYTTLNENKVVFKVPSSVSKNLKNSTYKKFNIVFTNNNNEEVVLYEGNYYTEIDNYTTALDNLYTSVIDDKIDEMNTIYTETQSKLDTIIEQLKQPLTSVVNNYVTNEYVTENTTIQTPTVNENTTSEMVENRNSISLSPVTLTKETIEDMRNSLNNQTKLNLEKAIKTIELDIKDTKNNLLKSPLNNKADYSISASDLGISNSLTNTGIKLDINTNPLNSEDLGLTLSSTIADIAPSFISSTTINNVIKR